MDVETVVGRNNTAFYLDLYIKNRYIISHRDVLSMASTTWKLPPSH